MRSKYAGKAEATGLADSDLRADMLKSMCLAVAEIIYTSHF